MFLCREVLVMDPFQYPYRSKERGDVWGQLAIHLNCTSHPKFKVTKRSVRDRLTLLQNRFKEKMKEEEKASGIDCEETEHWKKLLRKRKLQNPAEMIVQAPSK